MFAEKLEDIAEGFSLFDSWEERYSYLIELGERLPPFDQTQKTEDNFVRGCTSRVWLVAEIRDGRFHFSADSDAQIVRGLIYLLMAAYQDKTPEDVVSYDIEGAFEKLELHQHLSPNRRSGFFAMVERIKALNKP